LALATLVVLRRACRAQTRYLVACVGLAAMLLTPLAAFAWLRAAPDVPHEKGVGRLFSSQAAPGAEALITAINSAPAVGKGVRRLFPSPSVRGAMVVETLAGNDPRPLFLSAVVTGWVAGVAVLLARLAAGWWHVRRLERLARTRPASRWQPACQRIARRLGLNAGPHVVDSDRIDVPTVVGWLRPVILLPIAAVAN